MQIHYWAPQHVSEVVACLGRTEDVRFSPSGQRLAVAQFSNHRLAVFDICREQIAQKRIGLTHAIQISSPHINLPHGIDFIDEETIIVANRGGHVPIFRLPPIGSKAHEAELLHVIPAGDASLLSTPGSVAVLRKMDGPMEVLICNNYVHYVTRHLIEISKGCSVSSSEVLLKEWLQVPDGICISSDAHWIAISNHDMHSVCIYENAPSLNERSDPDALLRSVCYPHGLRFTSDCGYILLADAGAPYVHVYGRNGASWRGVRNPLLSFRVMNDEVFLRGHRNPTEGGPKGLDIDNDQSLLVTTCEHQPLAFFELGPMLQRASLYSHTSAEIDARNVPSGHTRAEAGCSQRLSDIRHELELHKRLCQAEARAKQAEKLFARVEMKHTALQRSRAWRLTAPVRAIVSVMRKRSRLRSGIRIYQKP